MNENKNKNYWWDVVTWLFGCARAIYDYSKEKPFPKRSDYQGSNEVREDGSGSSEDSGGNSSTRDREFQEPT